MNYVTSLQVICWVVWSAPWCNALSVKHVSACDGSVFIRFSLSPGESLRVVAELYFRVRTGWSVTAGLPSKSGTFPQPNLKLFVRVCLEKTDPPYKFFQLLESARTFRNRVNQTLLVFCPRKSIGTLTFGIS